MGAEVFHENIAPRVRPPDGHLRFRARPRPSLPHGPPGYAGVFSLCENPNEIPGQSIPVGPVGLPATCDVAPCGSPGAVPPVSVPAVEKTCVPTGILCVGPEEERPLFPGQTLPGLCQLVASACLPAREVVSQTTLTTPPVPLGNTPRLGVGVKAEPSGAPTVGSASHGPFVLVSDPPVVLCDTPCVLPTIGDHNAGTFGVILIVGSLTLNPETPVVLPLP